jgi:hypothetical protein
MRRHPTPGIPLVDLTPRHLAHLRTLTDREALLAELRPGGVVAEVGVDRGEFSERILRIARPRKLYLIDPWPGGRYGEDAAKEVRQRFAAELASGVVEIRRGRSVDVLADLADGHLDWVYLDSDHSYATTAAELALCRRKVAAGGVIAGHDYAIGSWDLWMKFGVIEAVNEFCHREDWEMVLRTTETRTNPSFALRAITDSST